MKTRIFHWVFGCTAAFAGMAFGQVPFGPPAIAPWDRPRGNEIRIRAPFVSMRLGREPVRTAAVPAVYVPGGAALSGQTLQPVPVDRGYVPPAPQPSYVPAPVPPQPQAYYQAPVLQELVPVRAVTHREFASWFVPVEGRHEVWLIHPKTCQPVHVCFTLPCGTPKKVRVQRNELEFDYGRCEVEIRFRNDGTVRVEYND